MIYLETISHSSPHISVLCTSTIRLTNTRKPVHNAMSERIANTSAHELFPIYCTKYKASLRAHNNAPTVPLLTKDEHHHHYLLDILMVYVLDSMLICWFTPVATCAESTKTHLRNSWRSSRRGGSVHYGDQISATQSCSHR